MRDVETELTQKGALPSPATALLVALLSVDAILAAGHVYFFASSHHNGRLLLSYDRGYGELFQYVKCVGLAVVFVACVVTTRQLRWLTWAVCFAYLGLDDALMLHEQISRSLRDSAGLAGQAEEMPMFAGFRWQDFFETGVAAMMGLILLGSLAITYRCCRGAFRRMSHGVVMGLFLLAFFGVGIDVIHEHQWVKPVRWLYHGLAFVEDGGEMLAISLICWFVARELFMSNASPLSRGPGGPPAASHPPA